MHGPSPPRGTPVFEDAYRNFSGYVARIGQRVLGRRDDVKDLVHDVFIAARHALSKLDSEAAMRAYLGVVTVRLARRHLRRERILSWVGMDSETDVEQLASLDARPEDRLLLGTVYDVLKTLPTNQRIAWTLRYIEGSQLEEVASMCGCSLATAKRRISAAHAAVSRSLADE
ncbi:MAG: RNA polymerase sigma factor [Myxococcaceae bacterium]